MSRPVRAVSVLLLALLLFGCGPSLIERGDRAMLFRRPGQAAQFYTQALAENPKLSQDPEFTAKLNRAHALAHCDMGRNLASAGRWDEAVAAFSDAVRADPDLPQTAEGLAWAKREAARAHLANALALADEGKLEDAMAELSTGAGLDPQNADVQRALAFGRQNPAIANVPAQTLHEQALRLEQEKRLGQMSRRLDEAIAADPNHVLARVARFRAKAAMGRATKHVTTAASLLPAKRLDRAQEELDKALAIWPFYNEASQLHARVKRLRGEAESLYRQAKALSDAAKWEDTVRVASAALDIFPFHAAAGALRDNARQNAAAAFVAAGRSELGRGPGRLEAAEAQFEKALHYIPGSTDALAGLAEADMRRGQETENWGLWGNALVWYLQAADHQATQGAKARVDAARARILERARCALSLTVPADRLAGDAALLQQHIRAGLAGVRSDVLTFVQAGADPKLPVYRATVRLGAVSIVERRVQSVRHVHRYTVRREVPNPDIPPLREELLAAQHELVHLEREYHRPCRRCDGDGRIECSKCRGRGRRRCSWCKGSGRMPCRKCKGKKKVNGKTCSSCKGSGRRDCGACHGGYRKCKDCDGDRRERCDHCDGTGRDSRVSDFELRRAQDCVHNLRMELHRQPLTIMAAFPAEWPYTIHFHEKHGSAEAFVDIASPADPRAVVRDTVRQTSVSKDALVENANPAVGLQPNPLVLPSDATTRDWLITHLGAATADRLRALTLNARAAELKARAESLSREGNQMHYVEAMVDLARVVQETQPSEADAILARLKESSQRR